MSDQIRAAWIVGTLTFMGSVAGAMIMADRQHSPGGPLPVERRAEPVESRTVPVDRRKQYGVIEAAAAKRGNENGL